MARIEKLSSTCKTSTSYALTVPCRQCAIFDRLGCRSPSDVRKILWTKSDETPQLTKFFCLRFKLTDSTMNPDVFFYDKKTLGFPPPPWSHISSIRNMADLTPVDSLWGRCILSTEKGYPKKAKAVVFNPLSMGPKVSIPREKPVKLARFWGPRPGLERIVKTSQGTIFLETVLVSGPRVLNWCQLFFRIGSVISICLCQVICREEGSFLWRWACWIFYHLSVPFLHDRLDRFGCLWLRVERCW